MKPNLISLWFSLTVAAALAAWPTPLHAQSASGSISGVATNGGSFDYTITLTNTGSVALNSFWYGWTTDGNNLPSNPSGASNSLGWANDLFENSIKWVNSSGTALAPGHSATFAFVSSDSPSAITTSPSGESVAYVGAIDFTQGVMNDSTPVFSPVLASTSTVTNTNSAPVTNSGPIITAQPQSQTVLTNTTVTFSVTATNATMYQWQSNLVDLAGETNASFILSNVVTSDDADYDVVVSSPSNSVTSATATLIVGFPASLIEEPASVSVSAGTPVTFQAQAIGVPAPQFQWMFNNTNLAGQTNSALILEAAIASLAGSYAVVVSNIFGPQTSSNAVLTVTPLTSATKEKLAVTIDPLGAGSVSPNLNGKSLIVANSYIVTAKAAKGQVFASWSGIALSDNASLTFVMPSISNATLTAHFIPSPFASNDVAGVYSGLFWDTNNPSNDSSGYFSATVGANGIMDGSVKIAGASAAFSTVLRADGSGTVELKPHGQSALVLTVQIDLAGSGTLTGTIADTNNTFTAQLSAQRTAFSGSHPAASYKGYYTWVMPGASGDAPAGYSYGTATVASGGGVQFSLFLSDGTTGSASAPISATGQTPLYVSLYSGKGSFLSWVTFSNSISALTTNGAYWFKSVDASQHDYGYPAPTPTPPARPYPDGFTLTNLSLLTGAYVAEARGINALDATSASLQLSAADLTSNISDTVTLNAGGIGGSSPGSTVNLANKTGLFTGAFEDPVSGKTVHFKGAILRALPAAYGYFISDNLSGSVLIEP